MKQSLLTARGNILLPQFLPTLSDQITLSADRNDSAFLTESFIAERLESGSDHLHAEAIAKAESQLFRQVLAHTTGNQLKAATVHGTSRVTLRSKLKSLGIDASDFSL